MALPIRGLATRWRAGAGITASGVESLPAGGAALLMEQCAPRGRATVVVGPLAPLVTERRPPTANRSRTGTAGPELLGMQDRLDAGELDELERLIAQARDAKAKS